MIKFINEFKIISFKNFILITLNLILAIPALYYVFILDINFINKSAAVGLTKKIIFYLLIFLIQF